MPRPFLPDISRKSRILVLFRHGQSQVLQAIRGKGHHLIGKMDGLFELAVELQGLQALCYDLLRIGLPHIYDIVDQAAVTEFRRRGF